MNSRLFAFAAGDHGDWTFTRAQVITGSPLAPASHLQILSSEPGVSAQSAVWVLRGITSNERYVKKEEKAQLVAKQESMRSPAASQAALIPIKKNSLWWALTQEERRNIFEEDSKHIQIGLKYAPMIARRLHHCRDLSEHEPFDFLTWFEYEPKHSGLFDDLVGELRGTTEWSYVEREIDFRLTQTLK